MVSLSYTAENSSLLYIYFNLLCMNSLGNEWVREGTHV